MSIGFRAHRVARWSRIDFSGYQLRIKLNRREIIAAGLGSIASTALNVQAQAPSSRALVGYLSPYGPTGRLSALWLKAFHEGLRDQGYVDGSNVAVESRYADDHYDELPALASELIAQRVHVLFAITTPAAVAARQATATVPIVFTFVSDPVRIGLVRSLGHPGGNVTGTTDVTADLIPKRLALLKEAIPGLTRVGALDNPDNPGATLALADLEAAARELGLTLRTATVRRVADVERAIAELVKAGVGALFVVADATMTESESAIVHVAASQRLPVMGWNRSWPEHGSLLSYGTDALDLQRRGAAMVGKILRGAKPDDLPVEQAANFELVVNLKAAAALGLVIPQSVVVRANDVIQ
jgi:putative ABC transport system substrate-binding protein